jgi:hypothetical protein
MRDNCLTENNNICINDHHANIGLFTYGIQSGEPALPDKTALSKSEGTMRVVTPKSATASGFQSEVMNIRLVKLV